jgi:hypothetical protein
VTCVSFPSLAAVLELLLRSVRRLGTNPVEFRTAQAFSGNTINLYSEYILSWPKETLADFLAPACSRQGRRLEIRESYPPFAMIPVLLKILTSVSLPPARRSRMSTSTSATTTGGWPPRTRGRKCRPPLRLSRRLHERATPRCVFLQSTPRRCLHVQSSGGARKERDEAS